MKLLVVIVSYRVVDLTLDCLRSIANEIETVPGLQVAVCENGTGDDSALKIEEEITQRGWQAWCTLTTLPINLGFTGGNNAVLKAALRSPDPPTYILLLNADTQVRPNALRALVDFMDDHREVGIAGSGMENLDGSPQRSAFRFLSALGQIETSMKLGLVSRLLRRWIVAPPVREETFQTDWVSGASMIIRRKVFDDIGVLDEGFFTYFDDIDFCFNARKAGWSTWYVPSSHVMHLAGQSTGVTVARPKRLPPYFYEARRRYFLKNHGFLYAALVDVCSILGLTLWQLRVHLTGKDNLDPPYLLKDTVRHSVFMKGFAVKDVENPALKHPKPGTQKSSPAQRP